MSATAARPPKCPRCETIQTLPEWSESMRTDETTHFWRCMTCGNEFETMDHLAEPQPSKAELAEEFLPNLVVE
ncbi:MAG TPA: hypothetical protein VIG56_08395 [Pseudolabrys sp.]|jgi:Zn ribbon nucleic-acid-binding protein